MADVYDALTCKRVYKPAYRHDVACSIILEGRGSHFDPDVVAAFEACADQFQEICRRYQAGAETDEPICDRGPPTPARKGVEAAVSSPDGKVVTA